jgi:hypothetical protein
VYPLAVINDDDVVIVEIESHVAAGFWKKSKTQKSKFALDKAATALRQRCAATAEVCAAEIMWRVLVHVRTCFLANFFVC